MKSVRRIRKKTAYHHGDLRRTLINAALQQIEQHGAGAVTLREVARMAGVSHQAPYRHFADRSELLAAVAEEGFRTLHAELVDKMRGAPNASAALRISGIIYVEFAVAHPSHFRVMFGAEAAACRTNSPSLAAEEEGLFGVLTQVIAEVRRDTASENDTLDYALTTWSLVHGLASLLVEGQLQGRVYGNRTPRELTELVARIIRQGFGGPSPQKANE